MAGLIRAAQSALRARPGQAGHWALRPSPAWGWDCGAMGEQDPLAHCAPGHGLEVAAGPGRGHRPEHLFPVKEKPLKQMLLVLGVGLFGQCHTLQQVGNDPGSVT